MPQLLRRCEGRERGGRRGRLQLLMRGEGKGEGREEEGKGDYSSYVYKCRICIQI